MYLARTQCRACGFARPADGTKSPNKEKLVPVFDLGVQPLANDFCSPNEEQAGYAPLKVMFCPNCTLGQLSVEVKPEILYRRYSYVTSNSDTMLRHFGSIAHLLAGQTPGKRMLEIGSNDGRMLSFFQKQGYTVQGIDPAANLAETAKQQLIPTVVGMFNEETAKEATQDGPFDAVLARHVFCHVKDWQDFIRCLALVTHKDSVVAIEAPYACDMLERGEFDTIYHEHTSYMTVRAMQALLEHLPFKLHRLQHFPIHGGAMMLLLRREDYGRDPDNSVAYHLKKEKADLETWGRFSQLAHANLAALKGFVASQRAVNKRVVGFGASAKCTVWVNACGFTRNDMEFVTDNTPGKQYKLVPGSDIPIVDEGALLRELPDYAVCCAWNYRLEILEKNALARSKGVKFIFPIPHLEVV